ncbi:MAG: twin-arginine translocase TatA/TatE family subunit [Alphaproteobacteria bacterium]
MGSFSIWHWLIVLAVVLILFGGGGKISKIMGDMAKGVKAFKKGLKDEDEAHAASAEAPKPIASAGTATASVTPSPEPVVRRDDSSRG